MNKTLFEELSAAAQGTIALLTGRRNAASFFDFSLRGLAGSLIAFLLSSALMAYGPTFLGEAGEPGGASRALFLSFLVYAVQQGIAFLVLRGLKREDGFVPYLVADNWTALFTALFLMLLTILGGGGSLALAVVVVMGLILEINIARLIVTLPPRQIVILILAQMAGTSAGILTLNAMFPALGLLPPF